MAGDVTNWGVQPHVEILTGVAGNFEAKVGRVAADVPILQPGVKPFLEFIRNRGLQLFAVDPLRE